MIRTTYGEIPDNLLEEFCAVAGHKLEDGQWSVIQEEVKYWQLINPASSVEVTRWAKKTGTLPIRDYNFEYALYRTAHLKDSKRAIDGQIVKVKAFNIPAAIKYASEKLFDSSGNPVYLPEILALKADEFYAKGTKPPRSYNRILREMKEEFIS